MIYEDFETYGVIDEGEYRRKEDVILAEMEVAEAYEVKLVEHSQVKAAARWVKANHIIDHGNDNLKEKEKIQTHYASKYEKCKSAYEQLKGKVSEKACV